MVFVLELFFYFCFYKLMRHEKPFFACVANLHLSNQPAKLQSLVEIFLKVGTYATVSFFSN